MKWMSRHKRSQVHGHALGNRVAVPESIAVVVAKGGVLDRGAYLGKSHRERRPSRKLRPVWLGSCKVMAPTKGLKAAGRGGGGGGDRRSGGDGGVCGWTVQAGHGVGVRVGVKAEHPLRVHLMSRPWLTEPPTKQAYWVKRLGSFCTPMVASTPPPSICPYTKSMICRPS